MCLPAPKLTDLSDDDAAQITLMTMLLPGDALRRGEADALLALHRLRFPARDVARLGHAAIIRAASDHRLPFAALPAMIAATPAAAHARALAAEIIPLDHDAAWMTVAVVFGGACLCLFGALAAQLIAIRADILRKKARWDFEDGEEVVTPPKGWPGGGWLATQERERR